MRRADYLALAEILKRTRADMARAEQHATTDAQRAISCARGMQAADIASDFARVAHLGGLSRADFLKACAPD